MTMQYQDSPVAQKGKQQKTSKGKKGAQKGTSMVKDKAGAIGLAMESVVSAIRLHVMENAKKFDAVHIGIVHTTSFKEPPATRGMATARKEKGKKTRVVRLWFESRCQQNIFPHTKSLLK